MRAINIQNANYKRNLWVTANWINVKWTRCRSACNINLQSALKAINWSAINKQSTKKKKDNLKYAIWLINTHRRAFSLPFTTHCIPAGAIWDLGYHHAQPQARCTNIIWQIKLSATLSTAHTCTQTNQSTRQL